MASVKRANVTFQLSGGQIDWIREKKTKKIVLLVNNFLEQSRKAEWQNLWLRSDLEVWKLIYLERVYFWVFIGTLSLSLDSAENRKLR